MKKTKIEWCDATVNPVCGCSFSCEYCYAKKLNNRFGWVKDFSKPEFFAHKLSALKRKKPTTIFMNSMSDIADWEDEWVEKTLEVINENPQHKYLFLTKRPKAYLFMQRKHKIGKNVWLGTTVESEQDECFRSEKHNTFLSIEPLMRDFGGSVGILLSKTKWIIIGAETGNRKEKIKPKRFWVENIVRAADDIGVPVFMKDSLLPIVGESEMRRDFPHEMGRVKR